MLSLVISVLSGIGISWITTRDLGVIWGIVCGIGAFMIVQILLSLLIRSRVNAVNAKIQRLMTETQQKINRKMQMFRQRPGCDPKSVQKMLEKDQFAALRQAIEITHEADKYALWSPLLKKQFNTMRMMLHFQMREFEQADALMPKCLFFDVRSIVTKMARMYQKKDPGIDAFFRKKAKRFKGEDLALAASVYAWILIKQDRSADALAVLVDAKKKTDHPVILENWERLINGKTRQFSNAGLGDAWYSLYLETPKIRQEKIRHGRGF